MRTGRETLGWKASRVGPLQHPAPSQDFDFLLPFLFPFLNERQDRYRIKWTQKKEHKISVISSN